MCPAAKNTARIWDVHAPDFPTESAPVLNSFKNCWYAFGTSNKISNKNENLQSEMSNIMKRCWLNKKSPGNFSFLIVVVKNQNDKAEFTMLESEFSDQILCISLSFLIYGEQQQDKSVT